MGAEKVGDQWGVEAGDTGDKGDGWGKGFQETRPAPGRGYVYRSWESCQHCESQIIEAITRESQSSSLN